MNVRDPFNLHRSPAFNIIRLSAQHAATEVTQRVIEAGTQAYETSKQAVEAVEATIEEMSFAVPKNVPSFTDPQRQAENKVWGSSGVTARANAHGAGMMNGVQEFFGKDKGNLPLYKDKPYSYASSRRKQPMWKQKRILAIFGLAIVLLYFLGAFERSTDTDTKAREGWSWLKRPEKAGSTVDWLDRRERVREAFVLSWDSYERYAWGYDEFHPVSKRGKQMTPKGMGWIIVDALDTLMLMNLTSRLSHAREWLSTTLDYDQDQEVNTFETTIRMLGGLLSAHYLSTEFPNMAPLADDDEGAAGEDLYLEKAKDLADRLMGAFDSPSGVPYASVNLKTLAGVPSHDDGGASSTAEAATLQLEFKYLTKLTGENFYWQKAENVIKVIDDNGMEDGLLPIYIYANDGHFRGNNIRLGSRGDSYYEYLIKQYLQTHQEEPVYKELWDESLAGVRKHLITYSETSQFTILAERPEGLHSELFPKMDHLVCFMPGTIALGVTGGISEAEAKKLSSWDKTKEEEMQLARELTQTCWGMYKAMATGLAAEITHFHVNDPPLTESASHASPSNKFAVDDESHADWKKDFQIKNADVHNLQRPETIESLFYMWRITGDVMYREWGWEMFQAFMNYTAVEDGGGFTSLSNANTIPPKIKDNMESFWLAETLKYFYLLFSPSDLLPLDQVVINTEAHPFPRFHLGPLYKTGWKRKPRGPDGKILPVPPVVTTDEDIKVEEKTVKIQEAVMTKMVEAPPAV
ncbi:glycosyl hydrolase family 47 protein [Phlyctema vagabunda]|uniref:alpha-1,2-Mannosidase n=1 Tax=Phlyctema vagabunda TaxID=108571 RepID=A0ABR4P1U1_9HELO